MSKPFISKSVFLLMFCLFFTAFGCDDGPGAIITGDTDRDSNIPVADEDEDRIATDRDNLWEEDNDTDVADEDMEDIVLDGEEDTVEIDEQDNLTNFRCLQMDDTIDFGAVYTEKEMKVTLISACEESVTISSLLISYRCRTQLGFRNRFSQTIPRRRNHHRTAVFSGCLSEVYFAFL